jgi:hypothetical protein
MNGFLLGLVVVSEASRGTQEASRQGDEPALGSGRPVGGLEPLDEDPFDTADVDEVEGQSSSASCVQTPRAIALGESQELLSLAQPCPGEGPRQELFEEAADRAPQGSPPADQPLRITQSVGSELTGIVVIVGASPSGRLRWMCLDEPAPVVDPYELSVAADGDLLTQVACGHRVDGLLKLDVVIGMHDALAPGGSVEALSYQRAQSGLLLFLEDTKRRLARRPMDACAGLGKAPANCLALDVIAVDPALSPEEALPQVGDTSFNVRFSLCVTHVGRIDDEAAMAGVLLEGPLKDGIVPVGTSDGVPQIVQDKASHDAAEKLPGVFEPIDEVG